MARSTDRSFRLGPWTVRPLLGELSGPDGDLHLEPKVMGVLVCLAERAGDVVTRDEFVAAVWDGRIVSDEVLSRCISMLRTRLGDNPRDPSYIRTVPKIGYQLLKDVEWLDPAPESAPAEPPPQPSPSDAAPQPAPATGRAPYQPGRWLGIAAAVALIAIAVFWLRDDASTELPANADPSLAVLPFSNLSDDPQNDYLSDGLTEDLIDRLAKLPGLQVVASTSAFAFKNRAIDVRDIAEQLGVQHVLQGSVRRDGDRVRITAALTDAASGLVQWSDSFHTEFRDIFSVQDEISAAIVGELRPRLAAASPADSSPPTRVMPAYERVLRGRFHLRKREEAPILRSIELFREAIELDPLFGDAYRHLAMAYALLPTYSYEDPAEMFALAEAALDRGVAMDASLTDRIYDVRAFLHFSRWEWIDAEQDFRRALQLTPNDSNLFQWYSQQLAATGQLDRALDAVTTARQLDMLSPVVNQRLAVVLQWVDADDRAYEQFELARELGMGPRANPEAYAVQLIRRGEHARAGDILLDLQRAFRRASDWIGPFIDALEDPSQRPRALAALNEAAENRQISTKYLQGAYVYLGDADAAIDAAFELLNEPQEFEVEFLFARENAIVRAHPRFGALLREIGLDRYWNEFGWPPYCRRDGGDIVCR